MSRDPYEKKGASFINVKYKYTFPRNILKEKQKFMTVILFQCFNMLI